MSARTRRKKKLRHRAKLIADAQKQFAEWLSLEGLPILDCWSPKEFKQYAELCDFLFQRRVQRDDLRSLVILMQNVSRGDSARKYADQLVEHRFKETSLYNVYDGNIRRKLHEFIDVYLMNSDDKYRRTLFSLFDWAYRGKYVRVLDIEKSMNDMKVLQVMNS